MNVKARRSIAVLLSLSLAATVAVAGGRPGEGPGARLSGAISAVHAGGLTLDEAVARVERKYEARVVRAEERTEDGRRVYRIRLLSADGRVFEVKVDAQTGDVF